MAMAQSAFVRPPDGPRAGYSLVKEHVPDGLRVENEKSISERLAAIFSPWSHLLQTS